VVSSEFTYCETLQDRQQAGLNTVLYSIELVIASLWLRQNLRTVMWFVAQRILARLEEV
jgi:hypothetical protein